MIPSLYEPFKHWSESGNVFLISDPHFNDSDCKLMNADWISPEKHIAYLNTHIHKNDTLICLGDCGDLDYIRQLKAGYKILIKGNHDDKGDSKYLKTVTKKIFDAAEMSRSAVLDQVKEEFPLCKISINKEYSFHLPFDRWFVKIDDNLFDEVYSGPLFISEKILLSHEPINGLPFCLNIHGHVHNGTHEYEDEFGAKHVNIASDVVDFTAINLNNLIKSGKLSDISTIHRITIDKAIANPVHKKG